MTPRIRRPIVPSPFQTSLIADPPTQCQCLRIQQPRPFSSSPHHGTRQRRDMFRWLDGPGAVFRNPLPGSTNYLNAYDLRGNLLRTSRSRRGAPEAEGNSGMGGMDDIVNDAPVGQNIAGRRSIPKETLDDLVPFPMNRQFRSQAVLSEELKDEIYHRVVTVGKGVKAVSAELGVEMSRIGAVVRLKSVEREWVKQNKPLATPYARAVLAMLPKTPFEAKMRPVVHESINDLPVHSATRAQLFHPVSESRHFTRVDAGKVFDSKLLPADDRIPHPELVELERKAHLGIERQQRIKEYQAKMQAETQELAELQKAKAEQKEKETLRVAPPQGRWEFRFKDIQVEWVGGDGRSRKGVGARYGIPHEDRKKGQVKIPRRVE